MIKIIKNKRILSDLFSKLVLGSRLPWLLFFTCFFYFSYFLVAVIVESSKKTEHSLYFFSSSFLKMPKSLQ